MALKSRFFNSENGDRKYSAEDFASYFRTFLSNGVFRDNSLELRVSAGGGMSVIVSPGFALINGYLAQNEDIYGISIDPVGNVGSRIDRIVLRWNLGIRGFEIDVVKGAATGAAPVPPTLTRTPLVYEIALADVFLTPGTTTINNSLIVDRRPEEDVCGYVRGTIDQIDSTTFFNQFTAIFNTWFDGIKGQLSTDAAGRLQTALDNVIAQVNDLSMETTQINNTLGDYRTDLANVPVNLTLKNGVQTYSTGSDLRVIRIGKFIYLTGSLKNINAANTIVATLPPGYRPSREIYWVEITSTSNNRTRYARWRLNPNGDLTLENTSDGQYNLTATTFWGIDKTFIIEAY